MWAAVGELVRRHAGALLAAVCVAAVSVGIGPDALTDLPPTSSSLSVVAALAGALALAWWRRRPGLVLLTSPWLLLLAVLLAPERSDALLLPVLVCAFLAGERLEGRRAPLAAAGGLVWLAVLFAASDIERIGTVMLTLPGYLAGTAVRLRRATAAELERRGRELETERALFAEVSVRNERARIASELHDIVGHALSAMVVQASAGQRLVDRSAESTQETLRSVAESARQGRADLRRLVDLLAGSPAVAPDLSVVTAIVDHAARTGLRVTCRLEGDPGGLTPAQTLAVVRVVQEGLTNALRHAPGAEVEVVVAEGSAEAPVTVQVRNGPGRGEPSGVPGGGRGLLGLRERVLAAGGAFVAGPTPGGGWQVEARL